MIERKPEWLHVEFSRKEVQAVADMMNRLNLHTVCREANCPNMGECYRKRTATFLILGENCTRHCRFCNVSKNRAWAPSTPTSPPMWRTRRSSSALSMWWSLP